MARQSKENDCGKAVTREILSLLFHDDRFQTVDLDEQCTDFSSIRQQLSQFDVSYVSFEVSFLDQINPKQLPAIAQVENGGMTHFVVISKITSKKVTLFDPQFGWYALDMVEFQKVFLGKMLLKNQKGRKPEVAKLTLLKPREIVFYSLFFLFESLSACLLFFSTNLDDSFIFSVVMAVLLLLFILFQNTLNGVVRKRLDKEILIPYLLDYGTKEDFPRLSKVLTLSVNHASCLVSYGALCVSFMFLLLLNGYYLSLMILIAILFAFLQLPLEKEKNKTNRFCSLEEKNFLENLGENNDIAINYFHKARSRGETLLITYVSVWIMEAIVLSVFIFLELQQLELLNVNAFIYYLGLSLTFSVTLNRFLASLRNEDQIIAMNELSCSLWSFLLKRKDSLKYNIIYKGDIKRDDRPARTRICKRSESSEGTEGNLQNRF